MNKTKKILILVIVLIMVLAITSFIAFYSWAMKPVDKNDTNPVTFEITSGMSKVDIAKKLKEENLIRNDKILDLYMLLKKPNLQKGVYELNKSMSAKDILYKFIVGDIHLELVTITIPEGKRIEDFAETIANNLNNVTKESFIAKVSDRTYVKSLIDSNKYWFLTEDTLNEEIYVPLEGYLYPDTYEFYKTDTESTVIEKLLTELGTKLEPFKEKITTNNLNVHDILTMASIVEVEAIKDEDRKMAAQVFYKRIASNDTIGSDVTSYYGAREALTTREDTLYVLYDVNPYNTRLQDGSMNGKLPIGPICSPSVSAIDAAVNPSETDYYYFVANTCTGEVFFTSTAREHAEKSRELQQICATN